MREGPEPSCSPQHTSHSSGYRGPCLGLWALPHYVLTPPGGGHGSLRYVPTHAPVLISLCLT